MPRPLLTLAAALAAVTLAACSPPARPVAPQTAQDDPAGAVPLAVEVTTDSGALATHQDDGTCRWHAPTYVLRDGAGTALDVGDVPGLDADGTTPGDIQDDGRCLLAVTLTAPAADVYDVEITVTAPESEGGGRPLPGAGETYSASGMISRTDAQDGRALPVFIDGPPAVY